MSGPDDDLDPRITLGPILPPGSIKLERREPMEVIGYHLGCINATLARIAEDIRYLRESIEEERGPDG